MAAHREVPQSYVLNIRVGPHLLVPSTPSSIKTDMQITNKMKIIQKKYIFIHIHSVPLMWRSILISNERPHEDVTYAMHSPLETLQELRWKVFSSADSSRQYWCLKRLFLISLAGTTVAAATSINIINDNLLCQPTTSSRQFGQRFAQINECGTHSA